MLYVLSVRPSYKHATCGSTLVYSHQLPGRPEHLLAFWNTKTNDLSVKSSAEVLTLAAHGAHAVVVSRSSQYAKFVVTLFDTVGSPVDTRSLHFEPSVASMTATHVVVGSADVLFVWQYRSPEVRGHV